VPVLAGLRRSPRAMRWMLRPKERAELGYWMMRAHQEGGELANDWYEEIFTDLFGLGRCDYAGKRVLDVGCGPRGSLEWAEMAAERVGLDPLADVYRDLGGRRHAMSYVAGPIEDPPLPSGCFDIVTSVNSLDHVDDVEAAARSLIRMLAPGGLLLLMTELNHEPTATEPQTFSWEVLDLLSPPLALLERRDLERTDDSVASCVRNKVPFDHENLASRPGVLWAKLRKRGR
jgi:SAM-dependent methyltransferase